MSKLERKLNKKLDWCFCSVDPSIKYSKALLADIVASIQQKGTQIIECNQGNLAINTEPSPEAGIVLVTVELIEGETSSF